MAPEWVRTRLTDVLALLRRIRSGAYWGFMGVIHRLAGTRLYERKWAYRIKSVDVIVSDIEHPHRQWLMEQLDVLWPFSSVLEIGCGYGPNVQLLATRFPTIEVMGLDINPIAVHEGNAGLAQLGIEHARLILGKADDLSQFTDRSIDVVFTDATLLYIGPDKIRQVIAEMRRVSRKALLFVEFHYSGHARDRKALGVHTRDGWVRDYRKILNHFFSDDTITFMKIPTDVWPTGRWPVYGYLINVAR